MEEISELLSAISITDTPVQPKYISEYEYNTRIRNSKTDSAIVIQKWYRGASYRLKRLPIILYIAKNYLIESAFIFSRDTLDGRTNSCIDETGIITLLSSKFGDRLKSPNIRMWYDVLLFDRQYGWIPVNIKTTTTLTSDNTGNLAMCVYAYTDQELPLSTTKSYENGKMSRILISKIREKKLNRLNKKDYYFIVLSKTDTRDVIVNSVRGLSVLTPNINNLPFQVCWKKNREFQRRPIKNSIQDFIVCIQSPNPSWKESFLIDIRKL
jgi:hypothetical protein